MENKCEHDVDARSASVAECNGDDSVIVDVWCKKCGKSGSAMILVTDFYFDAPCEADHE